MIHSNPQLVKLSYLVLEKRSSIGAPKLKKAPKWRKNKYLLQILSMPFHGQSSPDSSRVNSSRIIGNPCISRNREKEFCGEALAEAQYSEYTQFIVRSSRVDQYNQPRLIDVEVELGMLNVTLGSGLANHPDR